MERFGYLCFLIFIVSWFLRLTVRIPVLGVLRFDLVLAAVTLGSILFSAREKKIIGLSNPSVKSLSLLILVILAITPFAEWPGTVFKTGLLNFTKAIVFFYFTVILTQTEKRLKTLVIVFLACQTFRVAEPLYLHVTQGYWGSMASMANWEYMDRLSGAPYDVINPNGLAFVILTILPFCFSFSRLGGALWKIAAVIFVPVCLYALYLTGSRSGLIGLLVILILVFYNTKRKTLYLSALALAFVLSVGSMSDNFKDRYLSIFSPGTRNEATATGRIQGVIDAFEVGMRKPVFGHGLGTSLEANANFGNVAQISHNIYAEVYQEVGILGLVMFGVLILSILRNLWESRRNAAALYVQQMRIGFLIFSGMNLVFGLASYGFSSYEWYLIGGVSVVLKEQPWRGKGKN